MISTKTVMLNTILSVIKLLLTMIFYIPTLIIYIAYNYIVPPIITFIVLYNIAKKANANKAIICDVAIHILLLLTFISMKSNPGTDDSFGNLTKVVDSQVYAGLFTLAALIVLIFYIKFIKEARGVTKEPQKVNEQVSQNITVTNVPVSTTEDKKSISKTLLIICAVLVCLCGIITIDILAHKYKTINTNGERIRIINYKNQNYCSEVGTWCYEYNGRRIELDEYDDNSESYITWGKYRIRRNKVIYNGPYKETSSCKYAEIIEWNKKTLTLKCNDKTQTYYNTKYKKINY